MSAVEIEAKLVQLSCMGAAYPFPIPAGDKGQAVGAVLVLAAGRGGGDPAWRRRVVGRPDISRLRKARHFYSGSWAPRGTGPSLPPQEFPDMDARPHLSSPWDAVLRRFQAL